MKRSLLCSLVLLFLIGTVSCEKEPAVAPNAGNSADNVRATQPELLAAAVVEKAGWPIEEGEVLTQNNRRPSVLVRAGREVEVRLERGAVTVTMKGIAQGDGALGELVGIRHLGTRELRRYRVTGPPASGSLSALPLSHGPLASPQASRPRCALLVPPAPRPLRLICTGPKEVPP